MTDPELQRLRAADPVSEDALRADPHEQRIYEALRTKLFQEVDASASAPSARRRLFRRWRIPFAIAVVAGASAAYLTARETPTRVSSVACYEAPSLDAPTAVVANTGSSAVETCTDLWEEGAMGPGPAPPMEACVLSSGAVGVFPSSNGEVCARLGLPEATPSAVPRSTVTEGDSIGLLRALVEKFRPYDCLGVPTAKQIAREELRTRGLGATWEVDDAGPFTEERPCVTLSFDEEGRRVILVPTPHLPR